MIRTWPKRTCRLCPDSSLIYHDKESYQAHLAESHKKECYICEKCNYELIPHISNHHYYYHVKRDRFCPFCKITINGSGTVGGHVYNKHQDRIGRTEPEEPLCNNLDGDPSGEELVEMMKDYFQEPLVQNEKFCIISFKNYALYYDKELRAPLICFEVLSPAKAAQSSDQSFEKPHYYSYESLGNQQVTVKGIQYMKYVCGHIAAAANHRYDPESFKDTFALCNIVPMKRNFNCGVYGSVENHLRELSKKWQQVIIVTELVYDAKSAKKTAGCYMLHVPTKIVKTAHLYRPGRKTETQVFVLDHKDNREDNMYLFNDKIRTTIDHVAQITRRKVATRTASSYSWDIQDKTFPCPIKKCCKLFSSQQLVDKHCDENHKAYNCRFCIEEFETFLQLETHMKVKHGSYQCDFCEEPFPSKWLRVKHMVRHADVQAFQCPLCTTASKSKYQLIRHLKSHQDVEGYEEAMKSVCMLDETKEIIKNQEKLDPRATPTLFVANLQESISENTLKKEFEKFGAIQKIQIVKPDDESSTTCAFIHMETKEMACAAKRNKNKKNISDKACRITYCKNPTPELPENRLYSKKRISKHSPVCNHECVICDFSTKTLGLMKKHLITHTGYKPAICEICNKSFEDIYNLSAHIRVIHSKNFVSSDIPTLFIGNLEDSISEETIRAEFEEFGTILKIRIVRPDDESPAPCAFITFETAEMACVAKYSKHNKYIRDKICTISFCKDSSPKLHENRLHFKKSMSEDSNACKHYCVICNFFTRTPSEMKNHLTIHTGYKPVICETVNKTLENESNLGQQMRITHSKYYDSSDTPTLFVGNLEEFICEETLKEEFAEFGRILKIRIVRPDDESPAPCAFITFETAGMACLAKHSKHTKNILDKTCAISFCKNPDLELPENRLYSKERISRYSTKCNHKCVICDFSTKSPSDMRKHITIHTGYKPFECETCNKPFANKNHLHEHMRHIHNKSHESTGIPTLFIGNLDDAISEAILRTEFEEFGTILGIRIVRPDDESPAPNAFIKFETAEMASKAKISKNNKHILDKACKISFCKNSDPELPGNRLYSKKQISNHSSVSMHECVICDYSTKMPNDIKRHLLSHTGYKPFKCEICNIFFTVETSLRGHERRFHLKSDEIPTLKKSKEKSGESSSTINRKRKAPPPASSLKVKIVRNYIDSTSDEEMQE